ncbi:MAG: gluconate 2-dehydrogenase subunit 3 family protein [Bacteroidota bacterium]
MKRREILKYTALLTGAAISTPLLLSLESCKSENTKTVKSDQLYFFDKEQMELIGLIVDAILPKTDSPSATDVNVHLIIDQMVGEVYAVKDQNEYAAKFLSFSNHLMKQASEKPFNLLSTSQKEDILNKLSDSDNPEHKDAKEGYLSLKQQTIAYYLSTEEIAINFLNYLPVPGPYEGCISLESVGGKAWAL